jgi:hypothetical protein
MKRLVLMALLAMALPLAAFADNSVDFTNSGERVGSNKISQSEVDWVIRPVGQPVRPPNLKKPTALRGVVGVWNCESGDLVLLR